VSSATNESNGVARIRGIGTVGENPGLESSVAVFIDGVYRSRTGTGLTDLGELQQIEVLRGPQGTLFGRNASAGLLNITTAKPKFEFGGIAEATYGNFDNVRFQGGITGPVLGDKIAFRLDGLYNKRDGFLTDVVSGRTLADRDRYLVRGQLLIEPSSDISIRLIGDYNQKNEECCGAVILGPVRNLSRDASGNVVETPNSFANLIPALGGTPYQLPASGSNEAFVRRTSITPGVDYDQQTRDWGLSGELNWNLGDVNLTSITAYRRFVNRNGQDADFNSIDVLRRDEQYRRFSTFSQELRLQGSAFGDRLDWLVGAYYADEILDTDDDLKYGADYDAYVNAQLGGTLPLLASIVGFAPGPDGRLLSGTGVEEARFRQRSRNYAIFTHNVIDIIPDKVSLTLGGRYTNETKFLDSSFRTSNNLCGAFRNFTGTLPSPALGPAFAGARSLSCVINNTGGPGFNRNDPNATLKEDRFTGTAVLSFRPIDDLLTYASFSRGYKAGGFNLDPSALNATNPTPFDLQFAAEDVDAFELGAKLNVQGFTLNAALFYQKFKNFQLNTFNGVNFEVANLGGCKTDLGGRDRDLIAGNSPCALGDVGPGLRTRGVELEALFNPVKNLTLTSGITYALTTYADQLTGRDGVSLAPTLFQLPGERISNATDYVVTGSFAWTPPVSDLLSSLVYMDFRYQSGMNTGSDLDFEKIQSGFIVANARLGLYGPGEAWGIELWAQNLFDTLYQQVAADAPLQGGGTFRAVASGLAPTANGAFISFPAEPRTFGVTLRTRF
jgi:outer membrane receptor protein involved in Fe transport